MMQSLKHELKKIGSLSLLFLIGFGYILLIMKLFLKEYEINTYILSKAFIGALIAAKSVAIMDATPILNRFKNSPRYLSILYKTFIYTLAVIILGLIEHFLRAYHQTKEVGLAFKDMIREENIYQFFAVILCISIVFFLHNIARELDIYLGRNNLKKFFFNAPPLPLEKSTVANHKN